MRWIWQSGLLVLGARFAFANVEKTIFVAPAASETAANDPAVDGLVLDRLTPSEPVLRTSLNATFPTEDAPLGTTSWFYLENLRPDQRYEVRVCWLATQPTAFILTTYTLSDILADSALVSSLSHFSATKEHRNSPSERNSTKSVNNNDKSVLFLRVLAAADYYTTNTTLMENVPPVAVDLILDPFLANVFPRSLVPTAAWIVVVTVVSVVVARFISGLLSDLAATGRIEEEERKEDKKTQ